MSRLADDLPQVAELDLNPVLACPGGATVVDARVRVTSHAAADPFLRQLPAAASRRRPAPKLTFPTLCRKEQLTMTVTAARPYPSSRSSPPPGTPGTLHPAPHRPAHSDHDLGVNRSRHRL